MRALGFLIYCFVGVAGFLFGFVVMAPAQDAGNFNLTFSAQDIAIIGEALGEKPYKQVAPLISRLQAQINDHVARQQKDAADKAAKDKPKPDEPPAD